MILFLSKGGKTGCILFTSATAADCVIIVKLIVLLWLTHEKLSKSEFNESLDVENICYFLAFNRFSEAIGFSQVWLRYDYVKGTDYSPVGYKEDIYVLEEYRRYNIAQELSQYFENWLMKKGGTEIASDIETGNNVSGLFRLANRFREVY